MRATQTKQGTTSMTVRLNKDVKNQAQAIYSELGIDMTTAINVFLRQSIRNNGFPFKVNLNIPNSTTLAAMRATQNGEDMHGPFSSIEELMESLDSEN